MVLTSSSLFGWFFETLRQPVINGYILAGSLMGPDGCALVRELVQIESLAQARALRLAPQINRGSGGDHVCHAHLSQCSRRSKQASRTEFAGSGPALARSADSGQLAPMAHICSAGL